jgi:hypothetical protein
MITAGGYPPEFTETFEEGSFKSEEWIFENPDESITWELLEIGGNAPGDKAMGIQFPNYLIGKRDRLITPPFNLMWAEGPSLHFQHAYAKKYTPLTDSLIILVSPDCGESWERVLTKGEDGSGNFATHELSNDFWPETETDWCGDGWGSNCYTIELDKWSDQANVRIAFESYSAIGNPLFIDNMTLTTTIGVTEKEDRQETLKIYPNPTNGNFKVVIPEGGNYNILEIYSPMGAVVYRKNLSGILGVVEVVPEEEWVSGVYFLQVTGLSYTLNGVLVVK